MKLMIGLLALILAAGAAPAQRGGGHGRAGGASHSAPHVAPSPSHSGSHSSTPRLPGGSGGSRSIAPNTSPHATTTVPHFGSHSSTPRLPGSGTTSRSMVPSGRTRPTHYLPTVPGVALDSHGRIARSSTARHEFMRETGYPQGRPGYVIDHVVPLSRGGADAPSNMQWQTVREAKAKDKWERGPR